MWPVDIVKLQQSSPIYHFQQNRLTGPLECMLKSPMTNTLTYGLIERTSSMQDEIASETGHNDNGNDQMRKTK